MYLDLNRSRLWIIRIIFYAWIYPPIFKLRRPKAVIEFKLHFSKILQIVWRHTMITIYPICPWWNLFKNVQLKDWPSSYFFWSKCIFKNTLILPFNYILQKLTISMLFKQNTFMLFRYFTSGSSRSLYSKHVFILKRYYEQRKKLGLKRLSLNFARWQM